MKTQLFDIRAGEGRYALAGFFSLFGILCAHQMLETARDALFLASIPAERLPWMYIVIAVVASVIAFVQRQRRESNQQDCRPLVAWLVVSAGITAAFYFFVGRETFWTLSSLYIWTSVMNAVILVSLWTLAGAAFSSPQARRIFPFMGVGSVTGAITGTAIARYLTSILTARSLILGAAITLLITAVAVVPWLHRRATVDSSGGVAEAPEAPRRATVKRALSSRYARALVVLVVVGVLCTTMADFIFKSLVAQLVAPEELGSFFATVYLVTNSLSFIVQVFVAERMIRKLGLLPTVASLPTALLIGALTVVAGYQVVGALILITAAGSLEHSLYRTAIEILYVPFRPAIRRRLKEVVELMLRNSGKALASFLLLGLIALDVDIRWIAAIAAALALAWVGIALFTRREYVAHYRDELRDEILSSHLHLPDLDVTSIEVLLSELSAPEEERALGALKLIRDEGMTDIIPALVVYHPSFAVVDLALDIFVEHGRREVIHLADEIIRSDASARRRARLLRARSLIEPSRELLEEVADDESEICRSTASLLLATNGWLEEQAAREVIERTIAEGSELARESLALALGSAPGRFNDALLTLAEDPSELVREAAIASLGRRDTDEALARLLELLSHRPSSRPLRSALAGYQGRALTRIDQCLKQGTDDTRFRRALLSVLGQIATDDAASILQRELAREDNGVLRYRIVRELEWVRRAEPTVSLDMHVLRQTRSHLVERLDVSNEMSGHARALVSRRADMGEEWALLVDLVDSRDTNHFEVVVRVSALIDPVIDADTILYALVAGSRSQRVSAREILDSSLPVAIRGTIRATIDRLFEHEAMDIQTPSETPDELLQRFLDHPSGTVREVAARIDELAQRGQTARAPGSSRATETMTR